MVTLFFVAKGKSTVYELFSSEGILNSIPHQTTHYKVNGQNMDMIIGTQEDDGALLTMVRNDKSLPFYRDKNGGLAVHVNNDINRRDTTTPGALMSKIEPLMGFANDNNHSIKYVALKLDKGFDLNQFIDRNIHDSQDLPVYPSAVKINTIQAAKFSIGHYTAEATPDAVELYFDSRLQAEGYKKIRQEQGLTLYKTGTRLFLLNVEKKEAGHVSIITYAIKNK